jgi:ectoine hydroxylase
MNDFHDDGFLILPSLLSQDEVGALRAAADDLAARGAAVIDEQHAPVPKMLFGAHLVHDTFARVPRHPYLLHLVEQALGCSVHVFQSRLNVKSGFSGSGWAWHQDFNQWYRLDGMRTPRAAVVGVFLDDVNACNGPLMMIPRSQRRGHIFVPDDMEVPPAIVLDEANEHGIVPLMGPPGTVIVFDCLVLHGSAPNVSPWPRRIFYMNFVPAASRELEARRSRFECDPVPVPLTPLAENCLVAP